MTGPFGIRGHHIGNRPVHELAIRFAFGAAISLVAGIISILFGERVGGILLAFPAILPAALTLVERHSGTSAAVSDVRGAAVGALAMVGFALTAMYLATVIPAVAALALASAAWVAGAGCVYLVGKMMSAVLVETQYLPDVAANEVEPLIVALRRAHLMVATAESCTGGTLSALLTAVPSASDAVAGGITAYTDSAKSGLLGVPERVIADHGAISEESALCMAEGARQRFDTQLGIGVTGAIGKPVEGVEPGTMFVAVVGPGGRMCERLFNGGGSEAARDDAVRKAIEMALEAVRRAPS